jgi:diguanylate cyclase (GGDEF)-like protein
VSTVRGSDTVARIGGDEFVIILEALVKREDAGLVADKILSNVAKPFMLKRHRVNVTVSIGISIHPDNGDDAEVLLRAADYAMYSAKGQGKNRRLLCPTGLPGPSRDVAAE